MSDEEDYSSDSSDQDYVPCAGEAVSEEEESGEDEQLSLGDDAQDGQKNKGKKRKRKPAKQETFARKRTGGIKLEDEEQQEAEKDDDNYSKELEAQMEEEKKEKKVEQEKQRTDDLWSSFLTDVGQKPKPKPAAVSSDRGVQAASSVKKAAKPPEVTTAAPKKESKITITKEFDFAGETVRITKEVDADSKEAKAELKKKEQSEKTSETASTTKTFTPGVRKFGGGLGSVLGKINKNPTMSTLEKSRLDWNSFKQGEGIEEELQIHNRGKKGYVERQAFLQRTDQRQFELERDLRLGSSSKR